MQVPLLNLSFQNDPLKEDILAAMRPVIDAGRFIMGAEVEAFEKDLARFVGTKHTVTVSSGTDALLLALMAVGIGRGDEVVTTPFSFFATAGCVSRLGAKPVFADIEPESFNLDPDAAKAAINSRTKAVIPVHLFGRTAAKLDVSIPVIEDSAQSIGSGPLTGVSGCLSFFPSKNLGAFGDAGAVYTNDDAHADRLKLLRTHGGRPKYVHQAIGGNFRMDTLQAAVLKVKLPHLAAWTATRRENAARYNALFETQKLPAELILPKDAPGHIFNQYVIRAPKRDALKEALQKDGVGTEIYYPMPFHMQPCFKSLGYAEGAFPHSERAAKEALALPIFPGMTEAQQDYVVSRVAAFYGAGAK